MFDRHHCLATQYSLREMPRGSYYAELKKYWEFPCSSLGDVRLVRAFCYISLGIVESSVIDTLNTLVYESEWFGSSSALARVLQLSLSPLAGLCNDNVFIYFIFNVPPA